MERPDFEYESCSVCMAEKDLQTGCLERCYAGRLPELRPPEVTPVKFHHVSVGSLCLMFAAITFSPAPAVVAQQEAGQTSTPSKYLFVSNLELKPNQNNAYAKLEQEEVQAMHAAKAPSHYLALWSITGHNRLLYLSGFDSFADLQKNHEVTMAMPKLMDTLRTNNAAEAPLIVSRQSSIYSYEKDLSLMHPLDLSKMRFMRIVLFHVRRSRGEDWERTVKLMVKAYQSALPEAHWAMFQKMYGEGSGITYILVTPMESLATVDIMHDNGKKFRESVGEDQLKTLQNSLTADVESSESDLFALGPQISYVPDSWITSSPDFWGKK